MNKKSRNLERQISKRIKSLMSKQKVKVVTISKLLNLRPSSTSDMILGKSPWRIAYLIEIASFFNIALEQLIFRDTKLPVNMSKEFSLSIASLNQLIKKTGLQKKFIAKKSSLSPSQLSHIITGRRKAKPEVLKRIMEVISKANFD